MVLLYQLQRRRAGRSAKTPAPADFIQRYRTGAQDVDAQITCVLDTLKQRGLLDKTVVVITAEHGVEFNDSGAKTNGAGTAFNQAQLQVPLVIHGRYRPRPSAADRP